MNENSVLTPVPPAFAQAEEILIEKPECARRAGVSPRTIDAWMKDGRLPFLKIGRTVRFRWSQVLAHLENRNRRG